MHILRFVNEWTQLIITLHEWITDHLTLQKAHLKPLSFSLSFKHCMYTQLRGERRRLDSWEKNKTFFFITKVFFFHQQNFLFAVCMNIKHIFVVACTVNSPMLVFRELYWVYIYCYVFIFFSFLLCGSSCLIMCMHLSLFFLLFLGSSFSQLCSCVDSLLKSFYLISKSFCLFSLDTLMERSYNCLCLSVFL